MLHFYPVSGNIIRITTAHTKYDKPERKEEPP